MGHEAGTRGAFRFVVRELPEAPTVVTVGAWTPAKGYLVSTELVLPREVVAEATPDGPIVDVYGEQRQTQVVRFANTGALDLALLFYQLVNAATAEHDLGAPVAWPLRDYCGWSWPVVAATE
jgi:hypothetical protein